MTSINNLTQYDLELERVVKLCKGKKLVLLQFPDGLKPYATSVVDYLESKTKEVVFLIWLGDCFGACDTPDVNTAQCTPKSLGQVDLVVQFGHSEMMPSY